MVNNEDNISFDDVLGTEDSGWELLDGNGAMGFVPPTPTPTPAPAEEPDLGGDGDDDDIKYSFENEDDDLEVTPPEEGEEEENDNLFSYLAETLSEKGIISLNEGDKLESEEDIYQKVEESINTGIESWKKSLGEESLKYIDFLEKGGNPIDYINVNAEVDYSTVSLDTEDSKKEVISAYYKDKGFSESKIKTLIENAEDMEELDKDAEEAKLYFEDKKRSAKEELIKEQERQAELRNQQQEKFTSDVQSYIETSEEIRNFPLKSKKQKDEIRGYIFDKNVNYKQEDGSVVKISQYMADKIKRSQEQSSKLEDIVFDALIMKYGSAPIEKNTITKRNKRFEELAKNHKKQSGASKLSSSGGKGKNPGTTKTVSFDEWENL